MKMTVMSLEVGPFCSKCNHILIWLLAEGMERLCTDAAISMDGALPLLVAWAVNAKTLGTITRTEFTGAFGKLK
jgi:hypothetical protein